MTVLKSLKLLMVFLMALVPGISPAAAEQSTARMAVTDLEGLERVIARGRDLPNDILLARPGLDQATIRAIQDALKNHARELVAAILQGEDNQKHREMKFLTSVQDSDYDYVRAMYATAGYPQFSKFIDE